MQNVLQMLEADIGVSDCRGHIVFLAESVVLMAISLSVMGFRQLLALCARLLLKVETG